MWICPICKTTNEAYTCKSCSFDKTRDYIKHRSLSQLSESGRKIFKPKQPGDNVLMASSDTGYIFGRRMWRKQIKAVYFRNRKENIGEDAWDVSEKQDGSIVAWTEECGEELLTLYLAANGEIKANKDCRNMFLGYENLKSIFGLEFLQTSQTENMKYMFASCRELESLDVSGFNTSRVTNMSGMFSCCAKLKGLDVSHFDTSKVTDMQHMFSFCGNLSSLDVSHFDTSQVMDMKDMFASCDKMELSDVNNFNTDNIKKMSIPFSKYIGLPWGVDIGKKIKKQDGGDSKLSRNNSSMAGSDSRHNTNDLLLKYNSSWVKMSGESKKDFSKDNILMASNDPKYIFGKQMDRSQIKKVYLRNSKGNIGDNAWDVSERQDGSVLAWTEECGEGMFALYIAADGEIKANRDCRGMFLGYRNLKNIFGLKFLQTGQTEDMGYMFAACSKLESLDVSGFNTSRVTNMSDMFLCCAKLKGLDVSQFDTSKVRNMSDMFSCCTKLKGLDVSQFDTSKVRNMRRMFNYCRELLSLDVSHFDTHEVTDMKDMFANCNKIERLNLSNFDTGNIKNMYTSFSKYIALPRGIDAGIKTEEQDGFFQRLWKNK